MRIVPLLAAVYLVAFAAGACGQAFAPSSAEPALIAGTVTDTNGDIIPGATVTIEAGSVKSQSVAANDNGFFEINNVSPGTTYQVTVSARGFTAWKSSTGMLVPGQLDVLSGIKLAILGDAASVIVYASREELATEQVRIEEQQRVLGFIPNFYVSYDKNAAPLTARLKYRLAFKVATDPVTFAGTGFLAAIDQASRYPDYVEGIKGYGQRFGSIYANGLTDILVGGAFLPSILHQDPRYFYQGTGSRKSRLLHAISSPIICRGDNGKWQPNYSSLGGYLAAGAVANAYYPEANRGPGLLSRIFAVDVSANIANGLLQEFVLRKLTPKANDGN